MCQDIYQTIYRAKQLRRECRGFVSVIIRTSIWWQKLGHLWFVLLFSYWKKLYTQTSIWQTSPSDPFCSLFWIIHYIKCNVLSKSSIWEVGFVHYIAKFTIPRFVISRFECTILNVCYVYFLVAVIILKFFMWIKPCEWLLMISTTKCK